MPQFPFPVGEHYRLAQRSGLITAANAATASAGHLFAFRWADTTHIALVHRIRAEWQTVAGFTSAQEVALDIMRATAYTASHAGGTAATLTTTNTKKNTGAPVTKLTDARIADTGDLTAGTHTFDAHAMGFGGFSELAAAATVFKGAFAVDLNLGEMYGSPLVLRQNEGFVVRNLILMGAGGTARLSVEVDWSEVAKTDTRFS